MSSEKFKFEFAEEDSLNSDIQKKIQIEENKKETSLVPETGTLVPEAEQDSEISALTSAVAGVLSGAIKTIEGPISLTAELMDAGGSALLNMPSTKESNIN
jgi:hypothetical protein